MYPLTNQLLRLTQQLTAQYRHRSGTVANLLVLDPGNVDEHLGEYNDE